VAGVADAPADEFLRLTLSLYYTDLFGTCYRSAVAVDIMDLEVFLDQNRGRPVTTLGREPVKAFPKVLEPVDTTTRRGNA
jgi:hypothetical protein